MPVTVQKIDNAGEFRLKFEQRPIVVRPDGIGLFEIATIVIFMLVSFSLISAATDFADYFFALILAIFMFGAAGFLFFYSSYSLKIGEDEVSFASRGPFLVKIAAWSQGLENYHHIAGKRYYGQMHQLDNFQLIREVVLRHSSDRSYDVTLCRFIADDPEDPDQACSWHDEWHKACTLFAKAALDVVDGEQRKIDQAQIAGLFGDGGAAKLVKSYR